MDETYQDYINRVARLTLADSYASQLQSIQPSPKFVDGQPVSFPGYSIITPPAEEDSINQEFYTQLNQLAQKLFEQLDEGIVIPLSSESFHFTLADLIWDSTYRQAAADSPNYDQKLQQQIQESFQQYQTLAHSTQTISWELLGFGIRPRAILVYLAPKDQDSYEAIIKLRRAIYQNSGLMALGIEQQYDFTAHITLGYFGENITEVSKNKLSQVISQLNDSLLEIPPLIMTVQRAELRKFEDMMQYNRDSDWALVTWENK
ncbi:hypothetical protein Sta7437_2009 [Stanieria cyanosphaera PCC 7437]|uniref:DUF1868 domain-containing protein n=1 Tax=Stanieria cyanosphaera (strain ATCC 29371 / PCC 7437) TaxID=111780 RepID=K9XU17_STAC7|nr:hypothetical protein [Stanieria cyanosphaera]AFZ35561.1 hypothetical protein Sta7437_2009 [Stanieria cyanosphaera PCC 7437]